ncbi:OmpA family protein [Erythrobacter alti]|uniref:OmpA family protein n=1 Tax=Erythrobacter alti TaxID=1896145 RepID=UPI0030F3FE36
MKNRFPIFRIALLGAAAVSLTACEMRRDGASEDDPEPVATETPDGGEPTSAASPTPSESASPSASIFRDDLEEIDGLEVDTPTEPLALTIPFPDGADINARAERVLASVIRSDALEEDWPVILEGHTDSSGNDQANLRASRSRAEAVAAWLVERGVDDDRIQVIAFGEQNPAEPNALPDGSPNEPGRRANRRVELRIAPPVSTDEPRAERPNRSGN